METETHPAEITPSSRLHDYQSKEFMRYLGCLAESRTATKACEFFLSQHGGSFGARYVKAELQLLQSDGPGLVTRAASAPATTGNATWAAPLVGVESLIDGFLKIAHAASLLGRIPGVHRVPFNTKIPYESQAANYAWITEAGSVPVSAMIFSQSASLAVRKAAGIVTFTQELVRNMPPGAEETLRDTLRDGLVTFQDAAFLSTAAGTTAQPAGILNGITPVTPGADFAASVAALLDAFFAGRPGAQQVSLIAAPRQAAKLRTLNAGAGTGFPIVTTDAAGTKVVVVDGSALYYADGGLEVGISEQAAIQADSAPDSPPLATSVITSLWQLNLVGFKPIRTVNWFAAPGSVQFLA